MQNLTPQLAALIVCKLMHTQAVRFREGWVDASPDLPETDAAMMRDAFDSYIEQLTGHINHYKKICGMLSEDALMP